MSVEPRPIPLPATDRPVAPDDPFDDWRRPGPLVGYLTASLSVAVALGLAALLKHRDAQIDAALPLLLAVLVPAIRFGIWPAVYASLLAFLAYNFFFIEPYYTLSVARPSQVVGLMVFLMISVITAAIAGQARERARVAVDRVRATRRLYEFTRKLASIADWISVTDAAAAEVQAIMGRAVVILLERADDLEVAAAWPPEDQLGDNALNAARWAFACRETTGPGTGIHPDAGWMFLPLLIGRRPIGVLGIAATGPLFDPEQTVLLHSLAEQSAIAIDRARLAREIDRARAATEAERVRNLLLSSISHDFRTPLASILGAATSLTSYGDRFSPARSADLLASIREEAEHLDAMVRNLLSITRLEAGALDIHKDWLDVADLMDRVAAVARRRGARQPLHVEAAPGLPLIRADAGLIDQAIANVVANAVRLCPATANIRLAASQRAGFVDIVVEDDGPGIAADLLPRIFDKFVRAPREGGDGGEGSGLGLAITRGIVEAHGGGVKAESPIAGPHGSRFTLSLPIGSDTP
jgi:two-component system sensor histidine kinase KdpD